jgi:hypothetical protein
VTSVEDILSSVPNTQKVLLSHTQVSLEGNTAPGNMGPCLRGDLALQDSSSRYVHSSKHTPEQDQATPIMPDSFAKRKRKIQAAERAAATGKPNASLSSRERRLAKSVVGCQVKDEKMSSRKTTLHACPREALCFPVWFFPWGIFHVPSCSSPPRISLIRRPAARIYHRRCPYQACPAH